MCITHLGGCAKITLKGSLKSGCFQPFLCDVFLRVPEYSSQTLSNFLEVSCVIFRTIGQANYQAAIRKDDQLNNFKLIRRYAAT